MTYRVFNLFITANRYNLEWNPYPFGPYPCTLNLYRAPAVLVGKINGCYDYQNACIDWSFRYAMDYLNQWAQECNVEVIDYVANTLFSFFLL